MTAFLAILDDPNARVDAGGALLTAGGALVLLRVTPVGVHERLPQVAELAELARRPRPALRKS